MSKYLFLAIICSWTLNSWAQAWRSEPISPLDLQYITNQYTTIDDLAKRHLGRQFKGQTENDLQILQLLLDKQIVRRGQVSQLQAMGVVLGKLLKEQKGLNWVVYVDKLGRSRALQIVGVDEFIFPTTQISRLVEAGAKVDVAKVYAELEQAVKDIRNKPKFF